MEERKTKYGIIRGIITFENYASGALKECMLNAKSSIRLPCANLVPSYEREEARKKHIPSLTFYESGNLSNIALQKQTEISTPIGKIPAEFITFYESGKIKRVFPQNGKLSGYWSEKNEYDLAPIIRLKLPCGQINTKIIGILFYESGAVKSVTLWPADFIMVHTPCGELPLRIGIAFYESGAIRSVEPRRSVIVGTPIGELSAFDTEAIGIHADINSLAFDEEGGIASLTTSVNTVTVRADCGKEVVYHPGTVMSHFAEDMMSITPLKISFTKETVCFNNSAADTYPITGHEFFIGKFDINKEKMCNECEKCS